MLLLLTAFCLIQSDPNIIGKWMQVNPDRIGFNEIIEFTSDSLTIREEFFSKNKFEVNGNKLKITNTGSKGEKETIIESEFYLSNDTIIFTKNNGEVKDKMLRISENKGSKNLFGDWVGKTNKGVITYLSFNEDGTSSYNAILKSERFKYLISNKDLLIFTKSNPRVVDYKIKNNSLTLLYIDTGEEFTYRRAIDKKL